ncbi:MAG: cytochrome C peroxidase [Chloroflexi bacterium]|nr:cytochrome C peroxidase [Chloroflexota bacterium]
MKTFEKLHKSSGASKSTVLLRVFLGLMVLSLSLAVGIAFAGGSGKSSGKTKIIAQSSGGGGEAQSLASLKSIPIPEPANLGEFVSDKTAALQLGKALYWDVQAGGDGETACATCHFSSGVDARNKNTLNPGANGMFQVGGPNYALTPSDFPLVRHADPLDDESAITADKDDVIGSQGVVKSSLDGIVMGMAVDSCSIPADPVFHVGASNVRQSTGRNTPSTVNSVFNFRNFWDGRANNDFNGVNPFGTRDEGARIWKMMGGSLVQEAVSIPLASNASQSDGPPNNSVEMSCAGRSFAELGKKMLSLTPLAMQSVHPEDSVLGAIASTSAKGLSMSYADLIKKAYRSEYWQSETPVAGGFTQMEANFSLFWGLAIRQYMATLVSDDTPFDRYMEGDKTALTESQQKGLGLFEAGKTNCSKCHSGPEFTDASVGSVSANRLSRVKLADGTEAIQDTGFHNIGVRPISDDPGIGGGDPFGNPLSDARLALLGKFNDPMLDPPLGKDQETDSRAVVDGAFKTPTLRNIELTGPYFHNGGKSTLRQVIEFYNRGGDFGGMNASALDARIEPLGLSATDMDALVDFLMSLTDERVRWNRAPFDHPELCVPNGHVGDAMSVAADPMVSGAAMDDTMCMAATGRNGAGMPITPFLGLDPHMSES